MIIFIGAWWLEKRMGVTLAQLMEYPIGVFVIQDWLVGCVYQDMHLFSLVAFTPI